MTPRSLPRPPGPDQPPDHDQDPDPGPVMALPGFLALPPGADSPDPLPADHQVTSPPPGPAGAGSGRASSDASPADLTRGKRLAKPYEAVARGLIRAGGGLINSRVQVDEDDESWLPDSDDDKDIPEPLGRVAARRMPIPGAENMTDIEDIGMALVGLLAYAAKGLTSSWDARRRKRRARQPPAAGAVLHDDPGTGDA